MIKKKVKRKSEPKLKMAHLHVHSDYSLGDGALHIEKLIEKVKETESIESVALTDHGSLSGFLKFHKKAEDLGVPHILGEELYVSDDREEIAKRVEEKKSKKKVKDNDDQGDETYTREPNNHLIVLAKTWDGFRSIMKIHGEGVRNGFYYKPRTTHDVVKEMGKDIIVTTACMGGKAGTLIRDGKVKECERYLSEMKEAFKDDFYLELQFLELSEQHLINKHLLDFSKKLKIPYVITNDVHYLNRKDNKLHDMHKMIRRKKTFEDDLSDTIFTARELYLKTPDQILRSALKWEYDITQKQIIEGLDRTLEVAEKCKNIIVPTGKIHFPKFFPDPKNPDPNFDPAQYLKMKMNKGYQRRLKQGLIPIEQRQEYIERAKYEYDIIVRKNYTDYFLIVSDYTDFCHENRIFKGGGRGSAAGSVIAWFIGITEVDPIKNGLIFERFLNEDRNDPPDVDQDFDSERRYLVEEHLIETYGNEKIAHVISFGTYGAKGIGRDVGRVMGLDYKIIDMISKSFDNFKNFDENIQTACEANPEIAKFVEDNEDFTYYCSNLEGMVRQYSQHAGGTVVTPGPLEDYIPIMRIGGKIVTGLQEGADIREMSDLGVLKLDILGLNWCTILRRGIELIEERHGIDLWDKIWSIDYDDPKLMVEFAKGNTKDIFQYSSKPMREFMLRVAGSDKDKKKATLEGVKLIFNDLVAINAGWRPAVILSGATDTLAVNKHKKPKDIKYLHPSMKPSLEETYAALIYQEQFMRILMDTADLTAAESDKARKTLKYLNKGKEDKNSKSYKEFMILMEKLKKGWKKNGFIDEQIDELTRILAKFIDYSFNKSHSCSYAQAAVQGMFLKVYYPIEYFTGLLQSTKNMVKKDLKGRKDREKNPLQDFIEITKNHGIDILKPNVDSSGSNFKIEGDKIRAGLTMIKGCGDKAASSIELNQPFDSIEKFFSSKIDWRACHKGVIGVLIKTGAFDTLYPHRKRLEYAFELYNTFKGKIGKNQIKEIESTFLNYLKKAEKKIKEDYTEEEKMTLEFEQIGFHFGQHPFEKFEEIINEKDFILPSDIGNIKKGTVAGIIERIFVKKTKHNETMAFLDLSDNDGGKISITAWPDMWALYKKELKADNCVAIKVKRNNTKDPRYKNSFVIDDSDGKRSVIELNKLIK